MQKNCPKCRSKLQPAPQKFSLNLRDISFFISREDCCQSCATDIFREVFTQYCQGLIEMTQDGLRVDWQKFNRSGRQIWVLLSAQILVQEKKGARGAVRGLEDKDLTFRGATVFFAREEDKNAYGKLLTLAKAVRS